MHGFIMKLARGRAVSAGRRAEESRRFLFLTYVLSNTTLMSARMHHTIPTRIVPSQERRLNVRMFSVTKQGICVKCSMCQEVDRLNVVSPRIGVWWEN